MRISSVHSQTNRKNEEVWKQTGFQKNSCSFFFSFLFFLHQWLGGTASVLTGKILLIFVELTQINRLSQSVVRVSCSTGVSQSCFFYAPRCRTSRCWWGITREMWSDFILRNNIHKYASVSTERQTLKDLSAVVGSSLKGMRVLDRQLAFLHKAKNW